MSRDDVPRDDMTPHEFSDDDAEAIISGFAASEPELGAALDDLRSAFAAVEPPTVSGALNEFVVRGADPAPVTARAVAVPTVEPLVDPTPTRRHSVFASLSAFAGTALGKLCIGATAAAAGVGGASAAGVDTPLDAIFDDDSTVEIDETDIDDEPDLDGDELLDDTDIDDDELLDDTDIDDTDEGFQDGVADATDGLGDNEPDTDDPGSDDPDSDTDDDRNETEGSDDGDDDTGRSESDSGDDESDDTQDDDSDDDDHDSDDDAADADDDDDDGADDDEDDD